MLELSIDFNVVLCGFVWSSCAFVSCVLVAAVCEFQMSMLPVQVGI